MQDLIMKVQLWFAMQWQTFREKLEGAKRSWVVWFNTFMLTMLPIYDIFKDDFTTLQPYLPDNMYKWVGCAVVVINLILRFRTAKPLERK